jgi:hypothetical protein
MEIPMQPIHLLFSSILVACGEKDDTATTDTSDTATTQPINTDASFVYECYAEDGMCSVESVVATLDTETFTTYLNEEGQLTEDSCSTLCTEQAGVYYDYLCSCDYTGSDSDGNHPVTCEASVCAVEGRGHANISKLTTATGKSELARYFVRAYHAEASSVGAFLQLRAELQFHDVPVDLQQRCLKAAVEEVHHARMMAKLVQDEGCELPELQFGEFCERSLFELALDNAVEGCIYESFSALKAQYQSTNARDERVLTAMKVIARDETQHAQLAWDIHHHLMSRLTLDEQVQIRQAQREALGNVLTQATLDATRSGQPPVVLAQEFVRQMKAA